jgi:hypothetical protein
MNDQVNPTRLAPLTFPADVDWHVLCYMRQFPNFRANPTRDFWVVFESAEEANTAYDLIMADEQSPEYKEHGDIACATVAKMTTIKTDWCSFE